jgi:hypothetical protein
MRYSTHIDYLVGSIIYLGTSQFWWGRTPSNLAEELNWDAATLKDTLEAFPGLFRKSRDPLNNNEHSYSLRARYAQYKAKNGEEPKVVSDIPPVSMDKLKVIIDFVQKMSEYEQTNVRARHTNILLIVTATMTVLTSLFTGLGYLKKDSPSQPSVVRVEMVDPKNNLPGSNRQRKSPPIMRGV